MSVAVSDSGDAKRAVPGRPDDRVVRPADRVAVVRHVGATLASPFARGTSEGDASVAPYDTRGGYLERNRIVPRLLPTMMSGRLSPLASAVATIVPTPLLASIFFGS